MSAHPLIASRVTPEMKALISELAERDQITESAFIKRLLEAVLRATSFGAAPKASSRREAPRDERICVRLNPEDRLLLAERAAARSMPSATYVSVLIRSHLRALTPLPEAELRALKAALAQLATLGRNLNQIAKAIQQGKAATTGREDVRSMLKIAGRLRDHFRELLKANERSWAEGQRVTDL